MRIDRFALLHGFRAAAVRERERRRAAEEVEVAEARDFFYRELDAMAARRRASPHWREPTEEERAENLRQLDAWFAEHYGSAA